MSEPGGPAPPQVIRHSDGSFVLLNVDLDGFTNLQRVAMAITVWDQIKALMKASGEYKERDPHSFTPQGAVGSADDIDKVAARLTGTSWSSIGVVRPRALKQPDVLQGVLNGEIETLDDFKRALGMRVVARLDEGRPSAAKYANAFYGHGDKFDTAIEPLMRYLYPWKKRNFRFTHVNPKEAQRRIKKIDQVMADLAAAREDLAKRSHVASYAAPPEKRRENK